MPVLTPHIPASPTTRRRILFLALSGVRIHNPRLRHLGLSLPAFSARAKTIAELPSLGLLTLAGLTPPHWETEYREVDHLTPETADALAQSDWPLIAISALTARINEAYQLTRYLRQYGKTVILGGLHVSALPQEAAAHANAIVVGEAEPVWPQLLRDYEVGSLRPIYKATHPFNFAAAPLPRYDLLGISAYNRISLQTTRGCPLDCEFCGASRTISPFKQKPIELVRRDLEAILQRWPRPFIELADDNTFVSRTRSAELVALFSEYNIHWFTETDISIADNEHLLDQLAAAGCAQLLIGFESPAPDSLATTDSRGWKQRRLDRYVDDIARIQQRGISVNGCFTVGFDADTPNTFEHLRDYVRQSGLAQVQVTALTPFPGTALYTRLQQQKRLLPEIQWEQFTLFDVVFQPAQMSPDELRGGLEWLVSELYNPDIARQRDSAFRNLLKQSRRQEQSP